MELFENEVLEDLQLDGLKIIQNRKKYCFTSDAVLLANFVNAKKQDTVLEIGTGSGIISILISKKCQPKKIFAFEIQNYMADMAMRSVRYNKLEETIKIINKPIQNYKDMDVQNVDVIVSNPPYKKIGTSFINKSEEIAISRHEIALTLKEISEISGKLLKTGGKLYIMYDASRTAELIYELKRVRLEPKKMFFTQAAENKNATLIILEAVKDGKEGVKVLPTLITNDLSGEYIQTIQKLYK